MAALRNGIPSNAGGAMLMTWFEQCSLELLFISIRGYARRDSARLWNPSVVDHRPRFSKPFSAMNLLTISAFLLPGANSFRVDRGLQRRVDFPASSPSIATHPETSVRDPFGICRK